MKKHWLNSWLKASGIGLVLVTGCHSTSSDCSSCGSPRRTALFPNGPESNLAIRSQPVIIDHKSLPTMISEEKTLATAPDMKPSPADRPAKLKENQSAANWMPAAQPWVTQNVPAVQQKPAEIKAEPEIVVIQPSHNSVSDKSTVMTPNPTAKAPATMPIIPNEQGETIIESATPAFNTTTVQAAPVTTEKTTDSLMADVPSNVLYAHTADYSMLLGELQYVHSRKVWTLRYASFEEEDAHGGNVVLAEMGPMTRYKDGQRVRVTGKMMAPAGSHELNPTYRVETMRPVD